MAAEQFPPRHFPADARRTPETDSWPDVRQLVEQAAIGIWSLDADGQTTYVNSHLALMLGYDPAEMIGRRFTEFVRPASAVWAESSFDARKLGEAEEGGICDLMTKDGRLRRVRYDASPLRDEHHAIVGAVAMVTDSPTMMAEAATLYDRHEREIESLYDSAPIGLCVINRSLRYTRANRRLASMDGVPAGDHIGRTVREVLPGVADLFEPVLQKVLASGEPVADVDLTIPGDTTRIWTVDCSPIRDSVGTVLGVAAAISDVTEKRQAETNLRQFAYLVQNATDFIGMCDLDFRPFFVNRAGSTAVSMANKPDANVFDFFFEEDHDFLRNTFFPKVLAEGRASVEIRFRNFETGGAVWMRYSVVRIDDVDGRPTGYATISQDLTERRAGEAERKIAEDRLTHKRHILEMIARGEPLAATLDAIVALLETHWPDAIASIILIDEAGRMRVGAGSRLPSEYAAALAGLPIGEGIGSCGTAAFRRTPVLVSDIEHDPVWDNHKQLALPHGLRACWSIPIVTSANRFVGTVAVYYRDARSPQAADTGFASDAAASLAAIAIEKALVEQEMQEQAQALAVANRNKDEFLARLEHELRNPLGAIQTALELLKLKMEDQSPLERPRAVIDRQVRHIVRLIEDLSDLSRISSGKIELRRQYVDVAGIAREAADTVRPAATGRGQHFELSLPSRQVTVYADPARLTQIVVNLLNNAVKYTPVGGRIELIVSESYGTVSIRVRDNGIGIAPTMLREVFELYAQAHHLSEQAQGGIGIGLHLVQNLVRMHGGTVTVVSEGLGRGSEFEVRLPADDRRTESSQTFPHA